MIFCDLVIMIIIIIIFLVYDNNDNYYITFIEFLLSNWSYVVLFMCVAAAAKSLQSCPTLCDPIDGSPPGSPVPEILQARTVAWVAIAFSNSWKWKAKVKSLSHVWLYATQWTAAHQAPPSMGFSGQEYWSGVPLPFLFVCYPSLNFLMFLWGTISSLIFKMRTPRAILL